MEFFLSAENNLPIPADQDGSENNELEPNTCFYLLFTGRNLETFKRQI